MTEHEVIRWRENEIIKVQRESICLRMQYQFRFISLIKIKQCGGHIGHKQWIS